MRTTRNVKASGFAFTRAIESLPSAPIPVHRTQPVVHLGVRADILSSLNARRDITEAAREVIGEPDAIPVFHIIRGRQLH